MKGPPTRGFEAITGDWQGRLHQAGMPRFSVTVTIASARQASKNRVHYTGLDCSGHWTYLGHPGTTAGGHAYRFRELIDRGRGGKCKGSGIVSLNTAVQAHRLLYQFRGGGVVSRGILQPASG